MRRRRKALRRKLRGCEENEFSPVWSFGWVAIPYSTYLGDLGMPALYALSWLIQSWALLIARSAATFSIDCKLCSLLKLLAGTRRFSQFSWKCVMSPDSTTGPRFGSRTSSDWWPGVWPGVDKIVTDASPKTS